MESGPIFWENEFLEFQRLSVKPMNSDERMALVKKIRNKAEIYRKESRSNLLFLAWSVEDYKKWMRLARSIEFTITPMRAIIFESSKELPNVDRNIAPSHFDNFSFSLSVDHSSAYVFFDNSTNTTYTYPIGEDKKRIFFAKPIGLYQRSLSSLIYAHITKTPPLPNSIAFEIIDSSAPFSRDNFQPLGPFIPHPRFGKIDYGIVGDDPFNQITHKIEEKSYIIVKEYIVSTQVEKVIAISPRDKFVKECLNGESSSPKANSIKLDEPILVFRENELIRSSEFKKDDILFDEWANSAEGFETLKSLFIKINLK